MRYAREPPTSPSTVTKYSREPRWRDTNRNADKNGSIGSRDTKETFTNLR